MEFREPASGVINPGGFVVIDIYADGIQSPDLMRSYQSSFEILPQPGSTGELLFPEYDDVPPQYIPSNVDPPDPGQNLFFYPWFVDEDRADWAYAGSASAFSVGTVQTTSTGYQYPAVGGSVFLPGDEVELLSPKYLATYIFQASLDASGDFDVVFLREVPQSETPIATTYFQNQSLVFLAYTITGEVTVRVVEQAAFDNCADAQVIGDGVWAFETLNSTTDGPALPAGCDEGTGNGLSFEHDVWYEHVASCTGTLTISTCDDADYDTRLAVYGNGTAVCNCPTDNTTFIACNDDAAGCVSGTSELVLPVTNGECLTIRVGGAFGVEGSGNLTITCAPDTCENASPVAVDTVVEGSTANTSVNDNVGPDCGLGPVDSPGVWYSVSGTGGLMTASLCGGSDYDTRLTVYEGGCFGLSCVADANDSCPGVGINEEVSWCSGLGVEYLILVHGVGGAEGLFSLEVTTDDCDDGSACTTDTCDDTFGDLLSGSCTNTPNYAVGVECCDPSDGTKTIIDDGNPCTNDLCNPSTGVVTHPPGPNGPNPGCNDGLRCTLDVCSVGVCENQDINSLQLVCGSDADCPEEVICCQPGNPDCTAGFCYCEPHPTLALVPQPGSAPVAGCYLPGETAVVYVEMGFSEIPVVGAQFFLEYDPTTLQFVSIDPGSTVDGTSPYVLELNETVRPALGELDYVIGVSFGSSTQGPATIAAIRFTVLAECDAYVLFRPTGPQGQLNTFTAEGGAGIGADLIEPAPLNIRAAGPTMTACPADMIVTPDPAVLTKDVTWVDPTASDNCDVGTVPVNCVPSSGSTFSPGTTAVTCSAENSCGLPDSCTFDVTVVPPLMTVDLQYSPTMVPGPVQRCITFDLWDCDAPANVRHASVSQDVSFVSGSAPGVTVPIPGGDWECVMAYDELHSLRSTASDLATADGVDWTASFVGSRPSGGHWLVGGNLNGDPFIDILDFGVFFPLFLTPGSASTPCGTPFPDANVNGDSVVDLLDLVYISGNSLLASEPACCGGGVASKSVDGGPVTSITIRELRRRGLGHMAVADVNRDGVLDMNDMKAFLQGDVPPSGDGSSIRDPDGEKPKRGLRGQRPGR
jgi:hypothetical protein